MARPASQIQQGILMNSNTYSLSIPKYLSTQSERADKKCVSHFCKTALFPSVVRVALVECFEDLVGPALCEEIRGNDPRGADCEAVEI